MHPRSFWISALLITGTITAGLTLRLTNLGLPTFVTKFGGSILWALMVYWIVSTIGRQWPLVWLVLVATAVTFGVELFKLAHAPPLDAFRLTLPGKLLLGRYFSFGDLVAYAFAIGIGALLDRAIRRTKMRETG